MKRKTYRILLVSAGFIMLVLMIALISREALAVCVKNSEVCVDGPSTKTINGLKVTRSCWKFVAKYTCSGTTLVPDSHCQDLINQGCSPVSQTCDATSCVQTYECATGTATTQTGVGCNNQSVAINGLKYDTSYPPNDKFGVAASNMAALNDAVTGMIKNDASCVESPPGSGAYTCAQPISIFNGQGLKCRKDSTGFNKCCNLNGWGVNAGLNQCNQEEHTLGLARQAGRTHYIGSYCTHKNIFGCFAHAYVYCAFTSKIGRIVQEQGRIQLNKGWGSPKAPQCGGFTEQELTQIDFSLIDFSEYFADAFANKTNPPSASQMQGIINTYVNTLQNKGCSQFDPNC